MDSISSKLGNLMKGDSNKSTESRPVTSSENTTMQAKMFVYDEKAEKPITAATSAAAPTATSTHTSPPNPNDNPNLHKHNLPDFTILRTLGTGSFGRVHLVKLNSSGQFFAMKALRKSEIIKLRQVEHTVNERNILSVINFPLMVNMLCTFQDARHVFIVMEFVPGGELFTYLRKAGRFPAEVAKFYAAQVILAFENLHSKDIIYRDLKPENLLLGKEEKEDAKGNIKITDFGFAKYVPDQTWTLCGTPDYLAPEIIQSKGYGKAVDWWAMIAGHPPFYDDDHFKLYEKIITCKLKFPSFFDLLAKDLVKKLLTPDLSKRFGNLKDGVEDIKRHKWFQGVNWAMLAKGSIPAPFVPKVSSSGDTSNFDQYPEDHEPYGVPGVDVHRDKFKDF